MGLFGGKVTVVGSTVYNMAGELEKRGDYLKSLVAGSVITSSNFSMTEVLRDGYMDGPGMKARNFFRWANKPGNYDTVSVPQVSILNTTDYDYEAIGAQLPAEAGVNTYVLAVKVRRLNIGFFAEQHILANYGSRIDSEWSVVALDDTTARITWDDATFTDIPVPTDTGQQFMYITYLRVKTDGLLPPRTRMYIYEIGTGNAVLDAVPTILIPTGRFFPFIPIRHKNEFLSETNRPILYASAKKAYKKAFGQKFSKIVEQLDENEDIDDIDFAYVMYGVTLNTKEQASLKYLFKFFDYLRPYSSHATIPSYIDWREQVTSYYTYKLEYYGEYDSYEGDSDAQTFYISNTQPPVPPPGRPLNSIHIRSEGTSDVHLDMTIRWSVISKFGGSGLKKPDAKIDEVWITQGTTYDNGTSPIFVGTRIVEYGEDDDEVIEIHHQKSETEWETIQIIGLRHINEVFNGVAVEITAKEALDADDESGFIVPLHYETFRTMSIIESTQMYTSSVYLVLNYYEEVKKPWYATGAFMVIMVIAVIAITVATAGAGAAPSAGLLGSAASVGAALGFVGLTAVIVGAVANALAAMLLMQLISYGATAIFGEKIGMIIAAVASIIALNVGTSLMNGASMASTWGNMMSAMNILQMTASVGNGIAGYIQASAADWRAKSAELWKDYEKESKRYTDMWMEEFGYGQFMFDPTALTFETEAQFLERTLMTGSDIADMTLDMLTNFTDYTLNLNTI